MCVFTITDNRIVDAMERAHRRNVQVRVISDDDKAADAGSDIDRLERMEFPCASIAPITCTISLPSSINQNSSPVATTGCSASLHNEENFLITTDRDSVFKFYADVR